jgi:hypothetical protein
MAVIIMQRPASTDVGRRQGIGRCHALHEVLVVGEWVCGPCVIRAG